MNITLKHSTIMVLFVITCASAGQEQPRDARGSGKERPTLLTQLGHPGRIRGVAISGNGKLALTRGQDDNVALLWDLAAGRELRRLVGHTKQILSLALSQSGRGALTGSEDGTARLWDTASGAEVKRLQVKVKPEAVPVSLVAISSDFARALTDDGKTARLWDVLTGKEVNHFDQHTWWVSALAFSADGRYVLSGSMDGTAYIWATDKSEPVRLLDDGKAHRTIDYGMRGVVSQPIGILFGWLSSDGQRALTVRDDESARLWDTRTGTELRRFKGDAERHLTVRFAAVSADGKRAVALGDNLALLWDFERDKQTQFVGHADWVNSAAFSANGGLVLTGSNDGTARLWDASSGAALMHLKRRVFGVSAVAMSRDGRRFLSGGANGSTHVWDLASPRKPRLLEGHYGKVLAIALASNGRRAITGGHDATTRVWDTDKATEETQLKRQDSPVSSVAISADGRSAITCNYHHQTTLWDLEVRKRIQRLSDTGTFSVALSADKKRLLVDGANAQWVDLASGREVQKLEANFGMVTSVALSADEKHALMGNEEGELCRVNLESGSAIWRLKGHAGRVTSIALSSDGTRGLTGSRDGTARLWDLDTGKALHRLAEHGQFAASDQIGVSVALSSDGTHALTGGADGTARLWDAFAGVELCQLITLTDRSWAVVASDGRFDSSNVEKIGGLHWVFADEPYRTLSPEIFLRDYYEPGLFGRMLDPTERARLPFIRPLSELNRVQPEIRIEPIATAKDPGAALVTVEAAAAEDGYGTNGRTRRTDAYDLRLFRDGQLVGRWPKPKDGDDASPEPDATKPEDMRAWRDSNRMPLVHGKATKTFAVRLPREPGRKLEFTAYAFNEDRVKSGTASASYVVPRDVASPHPKAYLVSFGAAGFSDFAWDLSFSADDARLSAAKLSEALQAAGHYEVVPVVLATSRGGAGVAPKPGEAAATAANLKLVLDALAGRDINKPALARIPGGVKLEPATPDDLVLILVSSHGYTDKRGVYYLFPEDIGPPRGVGRLIDESRDKALLEACISSGELSAWLRGVDAGQLALIVDCCHAAATVESPGFKPGPMGSRGLGQLAYDKAMRVLAASAADDVALEALVKGEGHGLLTYALLRDGLADKKAAGADGALTLGGLLKYAETRVPTLYAEVLEAAKGGKGATSTGARVLVARGAELEPLAGELLAPGSTLLKRNAFQTPSLFDYARGRDATLRERRSEP
jgi:WD40 repeat protein